MFFLSNNNFLSRFSGKVQTKIMFTILNLSKVCTNFHPFSFDSNLLYNKKLFNLSLKKKIYFSELELIGLGYRVSLKKKIIRLNLGFSHLIFVVLPSSVFLLKRKSRIFFYSLNKTELTSLVACLLRFKRLNMYKLKGLKKRNVVVKLKPGKRTK
jgi:hypothetical protein